MQHTMALILGLAFLGATLLGHAIGPRQAAAKPSMDGALTGTWQTRHAGGIVEALVLDTSAGSNGGRFVSAKSRGGQQLERFEGRWRLHRNSLLPPDSRWQIHLVWHDRAWGRQTRELAIRHLSADRLVLGTIYLSSMNTDFRRIRR